MQYQQTGILLVGSNATSLVINTFAGEKQKEPEYQECDGCGAVPKLLLDLVDGRKLVACPKCAKKYETEGVPQGIGNKHALFKDPIRQQFKQLVYFPNLKGIPLSGDSSVVTFDETLEVMLFDRNAIESSSERTAGARFYRLCCAVFVLVNVYESDARETTQLWLNDISRYASSEMVIHLLLNFHRDAGYDLEEEDRLTQQYTDFFDSRADGNKAHHVVVPLIGHRLPDVEIALPGPQSAAAQQHQRTLDVALIFNEILPPYVLIDVVKHFEWVATEADEKKAHKLLIGVASSCNDVRIGRVRPEYKSKMTKTKIEPTEENEELAMKYFAFNKRIITETMTRALFVFLKRHCETKLNPRLQLQTTYEQFMKLEVDEDYYEELYSDTEKKKKCVIQ